VNPPAGTDSATDGLICKGVVENGRTCVKHTISNLVVSNVDGILSSSRAAIIEALETRILDCCSSSHSFIRLQGQPTGFAMITDPTLVNQELHVLASSDHLSTIVNSVIVMKVVCCLPIVS